MCALSMRKRPPTLRASTSTVTIMLVFTQDVLRCIMMKTGQFSLASPLFVELIDQECGLYWKLQFRYECNKPHHKDPRSW